MTMSMGAIAGVQGYSIHQIGLHWLIAAPAFAELIPRNWNGMPPPPPTRGAIELAGTVSHWLFPALLVVVPVRALLGYFYGEPYGEWHSFAKPVLIGLIALHVAASPYHAFWRKDGLPMRLFIPAQGGRKRGGRMRPRSREPDTAQIWQPGATTACGP